MKECKYSPWLQGCRHIIWGTLKSSVCSAKQGARTGCEIKPLEEGKARLDSNTTFSSGRQTCCTKGQSSVNGDAHQSGTRMSFSLSFGCFQISPRGFARDLGDNVVPFIEKLSYIWNESIIAACYVQCCGSNFNSTIAFKSD